MMMKKPLCLLFILGISCFNAPSPSYLRPGHPEWPAGWTADVPADSLERHYIFYRKYGIDCFGISPCAARGRESALIDLCRSRSIKLYLQLDTMCLLSYGEKTSTTEQIVQSLFEPWIRAGRRQFPVDVIPAVEIRLPAGIPEQELVPALERTVPGLLILTGNNDVYADRPDLASVMDGRYEMVVHPHLSIEPDSLSDYQIRRCLAGARSEADSLHAWFIPEITMPALPAGSDSLLSILLDVRADAVVWKGMISQSYYRKFHEFHKNLILQETQADPFEQSGR